MAPDQFYAKTDSEKLTKERIERIQAPRIERIERIEAWQHKYTVTVTVAVALTQSHARPQTT